MHAWTIYLSLFGDRSGTMFVLLVAIYDPNFMLLIFWLVQDEMLNFEDNYVIWDNGKRGDRFSQCCTWFNSYTKWRCLIRKWTCSWIGIRKEICFIVHGNRTKRLRKDVCVWIGNMYILENPLNLRQTLANWQGLQDENCTEQRGLAVKGLHQSRWNEWRG